MTVVSNSLKSIFAPGLPVLFRFRHLLIAVLVVALGYWLGRIVTDSLDTTETLISIGIFIILFTLVWRKPLFGLLALMVLTPFVEEWLEVPMGIGLPDLSFTRITIAFMAVTLLARAAAGEFQFRRLELVDFLALATVAGIMLAATKSNNPLNVIQEAITRHLVPLSLYFFARQIVRTRQDVTELFWAIAIFGFLAAAYAVFEQSTGIILFLNKGESADGLNTSYTASLRLIRGLLGSQNIGRALATTIPITFYLFFKYRPSLRKTLLLAMLAIQFYGMFLTYNRGSWYALGISLTVMQFFYPQFRRAYLVIVLAGAVVLWATWNQVSDSAVVQERLGKDTTTYNGRSPRWEAGFNMFKERPVAGWGFDAFKKEGYRYRTDGVQKKFSTGAIENDYLYIMVGSGLIGFLPYALFLLLPLVNSLRLFFRARAPGWRGFVTPEMIAVYWGVMGAFLLYSYTQVNSQSIVKMMPFAIAGAVIGSQVYLLRQPAAPVEERA